ncbi:MAG TPA: DEAD/DEAH box helicase family protein [Jatrophihabitans sp.]|uniref:DEAD/DEAH box helicase n=1 Tax=Jatrophihabitans sp. TaxID=1932789 RepID=UPI002F0246C7
MAVIGQAGKKNPISGAEGPPPEAVVQSWDKCFDWQAATIGLRRPQLGALHAVIGYWTTGESESATVVLPTGAGKTDLMIALLVAQQLGRVLVLVPSDGLREQIASKFETLGVLRSTEIVGGGAAAPRVGRVLHKFETTEDAAGFAAATNVIVATPQALAASPEATQQALFDECTHLFVDEAHHIAAPTWKRIRDALGDKPKIQFTATPYRQDGRRLGGRLVYTFSLRGAQDIGLYAPIDYLPIRGAEDPDKAIAEAALQLLQSDLDAGFDHLAMARVASISMAEKLRELYAALGPQFDPQVIHSRLSARKRKSALDKLATRESRVIVCVDMLGEGYDLPNLKIAALHDVHRSLGITLQFIGRFARTSSTVGTATVIAARPEGQLDENLRALYLEDADWNNLIVDLSATRTTLERDVDEFEAGFTGQTASLSVRNALPRMSTVVYRTTCIDWNPANLETMFPPERLVSGRMQLNADWRVIWFIVEVHTPVSWTDLQTVEDVNHVFYALYWDEARALLYINCSGLDGHYEREAQALCGDSVQLIRGPNVYRTMARLERRIPTTVGLLDNRNRWRRFTSHVGADVSEGFPTAEAQTKTQTNIFATGFEGGERASVGASLKGRIWSYAPVPSLKHWIDWCDKIGGLIINDAINVDTVIASFIRPEILTQWPNRVSLAVELPDSLENTSGEGPLLDLGDVQEALAFADLRVMTFEPEPPIIEIATPSWTARYQVDVNGEGMLVQPIGTEPIVRRARGDAPLSQILNRLGFRVILEDDAIVQQPGILLRPNRDLSPYDRDKFEMFNTSGIDIRRESQGQERDQQSIQARAIKSLMAEDWQVILDDDGAGEVADIVAIMRQQQTLRVRLTHCKFSCEDVPGARVKDLYELCGQAQKSARRRGSLPVMIERLIARERGRLRRGRRSGFERGDLDALYDMLDRASRSLPELEIVIVQPGLSRERVSEQILHLLACTEVYVREVGSADLTVICSP